MQESRRIVEVERNAKDELGKRHDKLVQLHEAHGKRIASLKKQNGELIGENRELKKRKSASVLQSEKLAMKQWESQQRIYEHSEKSAKTARHRNHNRVQDLRHRASEMQRLAPVFQQLVSGGGSLNGGGSMNGSWNLAGAVNAFRQAGHATAPPFPMPQQNNFQQNPFQFQQMHTNNNHFQMQPSHMPHSNNNFQPFQMQQN